MQGHSKATMRTCRKLNTPLTQSRITRDLHTIINRCLRKNWWPNVSTKVRTRKTSGSANRTVEMNWGGHTRVKDSSGWHLPKNVQEEELEEPWSEIQMETEIVGKTRRGKGNGSKPSSGAALSRPYALKWSNRRWLFSRILITFHFELCWKSKCHA